MSDKFFRNLILCFSLFNTLTMTLVISPNNCALAKKNKASSTVEPSEKNYKEGLKAYDNKDYEKAIDSFLQAIYFARNSYSPKSYYYLGLSYGELKNDNKAIEAYKKCIEQSLEPVPDAKVELGKLYLKQNRLNESMTIANEALCDYAGHGYRAQNLLGLVMEAMGDFDSAKWHYEEALGTRPWTYTVAWQNLIENAMKRKQFGEAVNNINALFTSEKPLKGVDFERMHLDLGVCYLAKGNTQGAIDAWHRVLDYNPNNQHAHFQLAVLYDSENHISSAIKEYQGFVASAPNDAKVPKIKERIMMLNQKIGENQALKPVQPSPYSLTPASPNNSASLKQIPPANQQYPRETDSGF